MKNVHDPITDLFRSRLEHTSMPVREDFWNELEGALPTPHLRRRVFYRVTAAASVLLILIGASAALWYFSPKQEISEAFQKVAVSTGNSGSMGVDVVHTELPAIHQSSRSAMPMASKSNPPAALYDEEETFSVSISMSFSYSSSSSANRSDTTPASQNAAYNPGVELVPAVVDAAHTTTVDSPKKKPVPAWSVGLEAASGLLSDQTGDDTYKRPWSAGLSVERLLSERFTIATGLQYTQLKSDFTSVTLPAVHQEQTLHYLGIPLKAKLNLYHDHKFNFYTSAGGMVEMCVDAKNVSTPDPLQLSLMGSVGLQYKLSSKMSLYIEPGLTYYFDDGSDVQTIRKERPLNINLLCGVKMNF